MAKLAVDQFVEVVKRSGLIDDERLSQALSGVDQSIQDSGVVASKLTRDGLLTEWQSEKLLQGRHKGFYLGKYKLLSQLGAGGMGAVYLAEHRVMRHRVAIKLLPHHLAGQKSYLDRFIQEARASAQLNHRNMVRAFDVDQEDKNHFLVMEYVEGTDLQALVSRNGPLSPQQAADYTRQAADGLAYAHRVGLIHRDIKPANLLVDKAGTVKILDMGLARFSDDSQASLTREYDQKMIGTVDYLAPEQAVDSHKVDARADIYSLGCTLYFMLSGDAPFPQGTMAQRIMLHQTAEPTDIHTLRSDVPEALIAIYRKMMAKRPDDRYQSAVEVSQALTEFLGDGGTGLTDGAGLDSSFAAPAGPSLNENLTLAPLEDEAVGRERPKSSPADSKVSDSKVSALAPSSGIKTGGSSGIKKSESSIRNGEKSGAKSHAKPKSGVQGGAKRPERKPEDMMDELLAPPPKPPVPLTSSGPTPVVRGKAAAHAHHEDRVPRLLIVIVVAIAAALALASMPLWLPMLLRVLF